MVRLQGFNLNVRYKRLIKTFKLKFLQNEV